MSSNNTPSVDGNDTWTAARLAVLGAITLVVAFTIISLIAETGINKF